MEVSGNDTILEKITKNWKMFYRASRRIDREAFDIMMGKARIYLTNENISPHLDPTEILIISILLEQEKEIEDLKTKIEEK